MQRIWDTVFLPWFCWTISRIIFFTIMFQWSALIFWKVIATVFKHDIINYNLFAWIFTSYHFICCRQKFTVNHTPTALFLCIFWEKSLGIGFCWSSWSTSNYFAVCFIRHWKYLYLHTLPQPLSLIAYRIYIFSLDSLKMLIINHS